MEALILILVAALGTLLGPLIGTFLSLLGGMLASLFLLLLDLTMWWLTGRWKTTRLAGAPTASADEGEATAQAPPTTTPRFRRLIRRLLIGASALTGVLSLILVAIDLWFIDDLARWLLAKQQARSGIAITAETITGNLFTGDFHATGITVQRRDHPAGAIDLTVRSLDASIAVWRVLDRPLVVEAVTVEGVRGRFERGIPGQQPVKKPLSKGIRIGNDQNHVEITIGEGDGKRKPKRPFVISTLTVTDLEVAYADHTRKRPLALPVTITQLTAAPLRSQWAVFDVLFRANTTGTVAGSPLRISTSGDGLGRDTQWHVDGLPVPLLADQIGGPFALLSAGTADVHVVDHWRMSGQQRVIVMDWSVVLNHVKAEVPEGTSTLMALLAKPAVSFINAKGGRVPLSFRVEIDENRFDGAASAEAAGLWEVVSDSAAATLAKALGIETDTVKDVGGTAVDKAKELLDRWRKK